VLRAARRSRRLRRRAGRAGAAGRVRARRVRGSDLQAGEAVRTATATCAPTHLGHHSFREFV